jgi:CheY-like chemotaxis protein
MGKKKKRSQRPSQIKKKREREEARERGDFSPASAPSEPRLATEGAPPARLLLVDDNPAYRKAFRRRLALEGYSVQDAADSDEALEKLGAFYPEVVITDLAMRSPTEGLDLIRRVKSAEPLLPIIMISAVGTFEEGAEAQRLGAARVVSKSRIDDEIGPLLAQIELSRQDYRANMEALDDLRAIQAEFGERGEIMPERERVADAMARLQAFLAREDLDQHVKSEAFDALLFIESRKLQRDARAQFESLIDRGAAAGGGSKTVAAENALERVTQSIASEFRGWSRLDPESLDTLRAAEYLYLQQERVGENIDFSRNVSFSYCFAVENEAKTRLRRKLQRLFSSDSTYRLIESFLERDRKHLSLYFHQFILQSMRGRQMDVTIDNVRQTLLRILEYHGRYKPDGLKALGVVVMCFGRNYAYQDGLRQTRVDNPLGLKGLDSDNEALDFADLLIALQHYRNPYIHPEISEPEKLSKVRETAFQCLGYLDKIA